MALLLAPAAHGLSHAGNAVTSISSRSGIATFECIGVYADYSGDDNRNSVCAVQYRTASQSEWKAGHPLWSDYASSKYRGSIVGLMPGTRYDIRLEVSDPEGAPEAVEFSVSTWARAFPEGKTLPVAGGSGSVNVSESGTEDGYVVYDGRAGAAVIDVNNAHDYCAIVDADFVIVRNLRLEGARKHGISIAAGRHDIVIENCEITNWGPGGIGRTGGWNYQDASGIWGNSGIARVVIQNNVIHTPRGGANGWYQGGHPLGPQAISFSETAGNHVVRYNRFYSAPNHYFNDVIGGERNNSKGPFPRDTDIYGNIIEHYEDDAVEMDGHLINCRVFKNVCLDGFVGISTQQTNDFIEGPGYIFRNIIGKYRLKDGQYRGVGFKLRGRDGAVYMYHNTLVHPGGAPFAIWDVSNDGKGLVNVTGLNNLYLCAGAAIKEGAFADKSNLFDYNCFTQPVAGVASLGSHNISQWTGDWNLVGAYNYFPSNDAAVIDKGCTIPNFNDHSAGVPDMGALEVGGDSIAFGPQEVIPYGPPGPASTARMSPAHLQEATSGHIWAYPNPFSGRASLAITGKGLGPGVVTVYSLAGRAVRTITLENGVAWWDGRDKTGREAVEGLYLIVYESQGEVRKTTAGKVR